MTNVIATGVMPLSDCVVVRAHRPIWSDPMTADFEVYAKTNLLSDVWSGVGKAKMSVDSCGTLISLPYSDLPGGMTDTMFFVIGLTVDTDDDGLSDSFESLVSGTDPVLADTDGDGMPDGWEYAYGIDPNSAIGCDGADYDVDGDGLVNIDEYRYGSDPCKADSDSDGLDDRMEVGAVEELRGDDFLWLDTSSLTTRFGDYVFYDSFSCEMALPLGVLINGVCYTNAIVNLDGFVTLKDPVDQSAYVGTGYDYYGGLSNYLWSAKHVTIAAYSSNLYAKPRVQDWHSELRCGTVSSGTRMYSVTEYRNVSHNSLRNTASALMSFQVIMPEDETNVVYVSYLSVSPSVAAADDMAAFGVQLPGTNCVPGRGVYANVTWNRSPGCFNEPLTLKYHLGTGTLPYASDCDGDGLDDFVERFVRHTDPYLADTDGDGLTDNIEVRSGTNPLCSDTDDDGMTDGWEVEHGLDPLSDDSEEDADFDGLVNVQEYKNGTDPRCRDTDGDFLDDVIEAWWIEDGVTNVPWFSVQPMVSFSPSQTVYTALISCEIPFVNRIGATSAEVAVADVNGIVHFGRQNATNQIRSISSCRDLSMPVNYECSVVAAYWTSLAMRPALGSTVTMGTAIADGKRYFVVEYDRIGLYYDGNDQNVSFQVSIPEGDPDLVFVRYGEINDRRTSGAQTIGMQGARVGGFSNWPCVNYRYPSPLPIVESGSALAFHFGSGGDPLVADTDQDGLDDRVESVIGTNPKLQDTDGDGYGDGLEVEYGMSPLCGSGVYGADGDFDGDGLANSEEPKFGTALNIADCDGDGLNDGDETGYIAVSNRLPWLTFDRFEDCTEDLLYSTHYRYYVNRGLPCPLSVQGEPVTNVTFTSFGWLYFNRAGSEDEWRGDGSFAFDRIVDRDVLAVAPFGDGSLFVTANAVVRPSSVRFGTATCDGAGYVVLEYDNLYRDLSNYRTNSISFQVAIPTNVTDCVYVRYRDVIGEYMDGRRCGIGMQTFDGKWLHSYCYQRAGSVFDGLALKFAFGYNTDPLERDSDADGIDDGDEVEVGLNPAEADSDGDGMPDGWERRYGMDPLSDCDDDGAAGDVDGDGLPNGMEYEYGTNPLVADTDGDGLTDGREVNEIGSDPLLPDTDRDGLSDKREADEIGSDPLLSDTDSDGIGDALELEIGTSPVNADSDGDGLADGWECKYGLDPLSAVGDDGADGDPDLDGLTNGDEQYYGSDPTAADTDGDGLDDADELIIGTEVLNGDTDGDGLPDGEELVLGTSPFLEDTDGDGLDDSWEHEYGFDPLSTEGSDVETSADDDEDGLTNLEEYECGSNPLSADSDGDGLDDYHEVRVSMTNPVRPDTDYDGIGDLEELSMGLDPRQPDTDGDGMNDGWEYRYRDYGFDPAVMNTDDDRTMMAAAGGGGRRPHTGPNDDLDGDGLTNAEECSFGTNPGVKDSDGDGVTDGDEVAQESDPADGSDNGISQSRVAVQFTFGDPSPSHSEKYRLEILPESGPADESAPAGYVLLNERYGVCETKTVMLKPGWRYAVRFYHAATDPDYHGSPNPDYDYELSWCSPSGLVLVDDPTELFGENGNSGYSFTGEGKVAYVQAVRIRHELLWETANKANQIFNPTPKDDYTGNSANEIEGDCIYSVPRNKLYVVGDPASDKLNVTERIVVCGIPAAYSDLLMCAAFNGDVVVEDSTVCFDQNFEASLHIRPPARTDVGQEDLAIRAGFDIDMDGRLSYEESVPLEVYRYRGEPRYLTLCGISDRQLLDEDDEIKKFVGWHAYSGIAAVTLPVARILLSTFYYGDDSEVWDFKKATSVSPVTLDPFASYSGFSEWLTHNSGAPFDAESMKGRIIEYGWDSETDVAEAIAGCTPFVPWIQKGPKWSPIEYYDLTDTGKILLSYYRETVESQAIRYIEDNGVDEVTIWVIGAEALQRIGIFADCKMTSTNELTVSIGEPGEFKGAMAVYTAFSQSIVLERGKLADLDAYYAVGRGRVTDPRYGFKVVKKEHWLEAPTYELDQIEFACELSDLYDFNYEDKDMSQCAATIQIGFGNGSYGRRHGRVFRHKIQINTTYRNPKF